MINPREDIAAALRELAQLTVLDEGNVQSFRVRAYENATRAVENMSGDIEKMTVAQLLKHDGIGKSSAKKIREYLQTGTIAKLETLRDKYPPGVVAVSRVPGIGPKAVAKLRAELGIASIADLKRALDHHDIRRLKGFGEKSEQKLQAAIQRLGLNEARPRTPLADALPLAQRIVKQLRAMPEVVRAEYCGSMRRFCETIGDVDIIVAATTRAAVIDRFVKFPFVDQVLVRGDTKTSILTRAGLQIDLRVVYKKHWGSAILYFTGSKAHNIRLRQRAISRGWLLNEYGLSDSSAGRIIASSDELSIYRALDLPFIAPQLREDNGEIERALAGNLPQGISTEQMCGDLHVHTDLSGDGRSSLADMRQRAESRGYHYLAITDHAENLTINGVSRKDLLAQRDYMRDLQQSHPDMRLLHGCELNIAADGSLDYDQDFRMGFDWCVAAIHSHFDMPQAQQTKRLIKAMQNPAVNVIGHLSGRMLGTRPGIDMDVDAVLSAAVETNTAIEINSALRRLDAAIGVLRRARQLGVKLVISSDAHHVRELDRMQWGTQHALRAWIEPQQVANTWSTQKFLAWSRHSREQ